MDYRETQKKPSLNRNVGPIKKRRKRKKRLKRIKSAIVIIMIFLVLIAAFKTSRKEETFSIVDLEERGCPQSLMNLAERNPETIDFVNHFDKYNGRPDEIDISDDVTKGRIPLFLQWDERWGYEKYGSDYLAITGCGPTCISMVYCGLTGNTDMNPLAIATRAEAEGFYVEGNGSSWNIMDILPEELGLEVHSVIFDKEHIKKELNSGRPIICILGPGDFTTTGHFIVLTGVDENGGIIVNDPNSIINSKKSWDIEQLMHQIRNLWSYS